MANLNIDDFSRERKTKQVNFRLSPSEYLHVKEQADKLGVSVSTYCQVLSVKTKIKAHKIAVEDSRKIAYELSKIGGNVNQIAKKVNQGGGTVEIAALNSIKKGLAEIWKQLDDLQGTGTKKG